MARAAAGGPLWSAALGPQLHCAPADGSPPTALVQVRNLPSVGFNHPTWSSHSSFRQSVVSSARPDSR